MEKTISFKDKEGMCQVTFDNEGCGHNEYMGFTGTRNGSGGQIDITPNTQHQTTLKQLWDTVHLKGKEFFENMTQEEKIKFNEMFPGFYENITWDRVCQYIITILNKVEEEDKTRRIQDYADQKDDLDQDDEKKLALIQHLGESIESLVDIEDNDNEYSLNGETYLILTNEEADEEFDTSVDSYIDECMEIPKHLMQYIDREAIRSDMANDRGSQLSHYDGEENYEDINGTTYYLYRR